jgi:hypothetical protein
VADPVRSPKRGMTRAGGLITLVFGLACFLGGGALFAFASADALVTRLFPLLAVFGLIVAVFGLKNTLLPSARHRRSVGD